MFGIFFKITAARCLENIGNSAQDYAAPRGNWVKMAPQPRDAEEFSASLGIC
jgi:hypothetical protein